MNAPHLYTEADGRAHADREIREDHWTVHHARRYLAECAQMGVAEGRDDFDLGFMAAIREFAGAPRALLSFDEIVAELSAGRAVIEHVRGQTTTYRARDASEVDAIVADLMLRMIRLGVYIETAP